MIGRAHQREDDAAVEEVDADRRPGEADDDRPDHHVADKSPDDGRNGGEKLDEHFERLLELAAAELGNKDRRPQPQRRRQQQSEASHGQCPHQQRKGSELRLGLGCRPPLGTGQELDEVQLAEEHRRRFAQHEEKDGKDEKDCAPAAKSDDPLRQRFGTVQGQVNPAGKPAGGTPRPGTRSETTHARRREHIQVRAPPSGLPCPRSSRGRP